MNPDYEIARCRAVQAEMRRQQDAPAWLVALGILDWEHEIRLIEREQMFTASNDKESARDKPIPKTKKAKAKVATVMSEFKEGSLHSGGSDKIVTNPKQGIAIALSEARKKA